MCRGYYAGKLSVIFFHFFFRNFRKTAEAEYQLFFVCLSVRPHGTAGVPTGGIFPEI